MDLMTSLLALTIQLSEIKNKVDILVQQQYKETIQDKTLNALIQCESGGNEKAINYEDIKVNGAPSKGILQFSPYTFLKEGKRYGYFPASFTLAESNMMIWNAELQREIAWEMLQEPYGYLHWKICSARMKIPQKLTQK